MHLYCSLKQSKLPEPHQTFCLLLNIKSRLSTFGNMTGNMAGFFFTSDLGAGLSESSWRELSDPGDAFYQERQDG